MWPSFSSNIETRQKSVTNYVLLHIVDVFSVIVIIAALWHVLHTTVAPSNQSRRARGWFADVFHQEPTVAVHSSAAASTPAAATLHKDKTSVFAQVAKTDAGSGTLGSFAWNSIFAEQERAEDGDAVAPPRSSNAKVVVEPTRPPRTSNEKREAAIPANRNIPWVIWNTIFAKQEFDDVDESTDMLEQFAPVLNVMRSAWDSVVALSQQVKADVEEGSTMRKVDQIVEPALNGIRSVWNNIVADQGGAVRGAETKPVADEPVRKDEELERFRATSERESSIQRTAKDSERVSDHPNLQTFFSMFEPQNFERVPQTQNTYNERLKSLRKTLKRASADGSQAASDLMSKWVEAGNQEKTRKGSQTTSSFIISNFLAPQDDGGDIVASDAKRNLEGRVTDPVSALLLSLNEAARAGSRSAANILTEFFNAIFSDEKQSSSTLENPVSMSAFFEGYFKQAAVRPETWDSHDKTVKSFLKYVEKSARSGSKSALELIKSVFDMDEEKPPHVDTKKGSKSPKINEDEESKGKISGIFVPQAEERFNVRIPKIAAEAAKGKIFDIFVPQAQEGDIDVAVDQDATPLSDLFENLYKATIAGRNGDKAPKDISSSERPLSSILSHIMVPQDLAQDHVTRKVAGKSKTPTEPVSALLLSLNEAAQAGSRSASTILTQFFRSLLADQATATSTSWQTPSSDISALFAEYFAKASKRPETWDSYDKAAKSFVKYVERSGREGSRSALALIKSIFEGESEPNRKGASPATNPPAGETGTIFDFFVPQYDVEGATKVTSNQASTPLSDLFDYLKKFMIAGDENAAKILSQWKQATSQVYNKGSVNDEKSKVPFENTDFKPRNSEGVEAGGERKAEIELERAEAEWNVARLKEEIMRLEFEKKKMDYEEQRRRLSKAN